MLNWSLQLTEQVGVGLAELLMRIAVIAEAENQIAEALIAKGSTGHTDLAAALGAFDTSRNYTPSLLLTPAASALDLDAQRLAALGIEVVIIPGLSKQVLIDPSAARGWLADMTLIAPEPSVLGTQIGLGLWGKVGATQNGIAVVK